MTMFGEFSGLGPLPGDASASELLERVQTLKAVGMGLSPMHPSDFAALDAELRAAYEAYEADRPVLEVPWELAPETMRAFEAVWGLNIEVIVVGPVPVAVAEDPAPPKCTCPGFCYMHGRYPGPV